MWKRFKRWSVFSALLVSRWVLSLFPLGLALNLGARFGRLARHLVPVERERAVTQLMERLEVSQAHAEERVAVMFEHLGKTVVELLLLKKIAPRLSEYVELDPDSLELIRGAAAQGRGLIGVTAHLGNWELFAQRVHAAGFPVFAMARANPNPYLGRWLVLERRAGGIETIDRDQALSSTVRALRTGAILALLIDQDTRVPSTFVPFLGRPASTPTAPARLALGGGGRPLLVGFAIRREWGLRIEVREVSTEGLEGQTREARVQDLTARLSQEIERAVRAHPEQWVWFHRRWKTQPRA